ncbi:MAG: alpha/beta hydrolase [Thaumarchaeota archaeon]|nr:alpha/beta hydrolase [Nitrososphaerota archaeon]
MNDKVIEQGWVENDNIRLHYLDAYKNADSKLTPLFYVPGDLEGAENLEFDLQMLAPRRCISVSLRGRGKSDAPKKNYTFFHHVSDIESIVVNIGLKSFCLMSYSISVSYAIEFAARHPEFLKGFIIIDYPPRYPAMSDEWVSSVLFGMAEQVRSEVVTALQRESEEIPLWDRLDKIGCPVLILKGGLSGSYLDQNTVSLYLEHLPNAKVITLENSGHVVWEPDYYGFIKVVRDFLSQIDT